MFVGTKKQKPFELRRVYRLCGDKIPLNPRTRVSMLYRCVSPRNTPTIRSFICILYYFEVQNVFVLSVPDPMEAFPIVTINRWDPAAVLRFVARGYGIRNRVHRSHSAADSAHLSGLVYTIETMNVRCEIVFGMTNARHGFYELFENLICIVPTTRFKRPPITTGTIAFSNANAEEKVQFSTPILWAPLARTHSTVNLSNARVSDVFLSPF